MRISALDRLLQQSIDTVMISCHLLATVSNLLPRSQKLRFRIWVQNGNRLGRSCRAALTFSTVECNLLPVVRQPLTRASVQHEIFRTKL